MLSDVAQDIVHVWGLAWELAPDDVANALKPLLPAGCALLGLPLLPLDRRARRTGRALLRLRLDGDGDLASAVAALHGQCIGTRWLDARPSCAAEWHSQQRAIAAVEVKVGLRAPQTFSQPAPPALGAARPDDVKLDFVVLCHIGEAAALGDFDLNNLPEGRVDLLARCVSAALFVSHGVRAGCRIWLLLRDAGIGISCDGACARGLHPDERTIASHLRRALRSEAAAGWGVQRGETLDGRLRALLGGGCNGDDAPVESTAACGSGQPGGLIVLHELGAPLTPQLLSEACPHAGGPRVLVLGDHRGFTSADEACFDALGGVRASCSPVPLLASHCIVLAHAIVDAAACAAGGAGRGGEG